MAFLNWYNKQFKEEVKLESMGNFKNISTIRDAEQYKETEAFMEMKSSQIFKYKALEMKKLKEQKRWYDIVCGCCAKDWEEVEVFITNQGILSTIHGSVVDFFLFTADFKF